MPQRDRNAPLSSGSVPSRIIGIIASALSDSALPEDDNGGAMINWTDVAQFVATVAAKRPAGQPSITLETLPGGAGERKMRLGVVNDDMPFLVDSVAAAISSAGLTVDRIIHPVVAAGGWQIAPVLRKKCRGATIEANSAHSQELPRLSGDRWGL